MRNVLLILAAVIMMAASLYWLASGGHRGWSQTRVPVKTVDEVTGLEGITYDERFVPGLDFLGASALAAGVLALASRFLKPQSTPTRHPTLL
ncbi:MAG: hypothetical protein FJ404_02040 [Verrucomicrobia bacterium]|nr:hypothetical protein [Verrucomicrobiota bacterium]